MSEFAANIALGLHVALTLENVMFCMLGVTVGMLVGVLPGIGALAAIAMLFPLTIQLAPIPGLVMLAGIYYGSVYGGATASILLNLPGTTAATVTCLDGHPLAKQGRAGVALFIAALASFVGGSIGILLMMFASPLIVRFALDFGPAEYFSLMVLGLVAASVISSGSMVKALAMVVFGMLMGVVGMDMYTAQLRLTFGNINLMDGVSLVAVAMGFFGLTEVIDSIRNVQVGKIEQRVSLKSMIPPWSDIKVAIKPFLRGSAVGSFFGALPGTGPTIASFVAYAIERRMSKTPERFGHGAIEGIASPEASNNAADQTAFIPTMTLGIPGTPVMALILGVMMMHGILPGPKVVTDQPDLFWGLVMSFWIGNLMLLVLSIPMINVWVRVLQVPYALLYPSVVMFVCIGVYSLSYSSFEVYMLLLFGFVGYVMRLLDFPAAPLLLGLVLGPMIEENFRRTMLLSRGSFDMLVERPVSAVFLLITAAMIAWGIRNLIFGLRGRARLAGSAD